MFNFADFVMVKGNAIASSRPSMTTLVRSSFLNNKGGVSIYFHGKFGLCMILFCFVNKIYLTKRMLQSPTAKPHDRHQFCRWWR